MGDKGEKDGKEDKKVAIQRSVGFIPKSYDRLPKEVYKSMFFSTTSGEAYEEPSMKASSSTGALEDHRGTNVKEFLGPNTQKYDKSGPQAPQWRREMCEYTKSYTSLPLDHVSINQQLRNLFKTQQEDSTLKSGGAGAISSVTTSNSYHARIPQDKMEKAIGQNFKPAQQMHVDPKQPLGDVNSQFHNDFRKPTASQVAMARVENFKPPYDMHLAHPVNIKHRSHYAQNYNASRYERRFRENHLPPVGTKEPMSGYTGKRNFKETDSGKSPDFTKVSERYLLQLPGPSECETNASHS